MKIRGRVFALLFLFNGTITFGASTTGYEVKELGQGSIFETLGVKAGDRILSYDGKNVVSVNDSLELFDKLKSNSVKTVVVERNGKKQTLKYQVH